MLGCPGALDDFIKGNRSDSFLPYTESNLPDVIKGATLRSKFFRLQRVVLCNQKDVSDLEHGGKHLHLSGPGDNYFERINMLGRGKFGVVDRVFSRQTLQQYARKVIHRGASAWLDSRMCRQFESEIQALKKLSHPHIVKLVGSYTDQDHLGLIMTPIAEMDLNEYLRSPSIDPVLRKRCLRAYFGCLATALAYLHQQDVRHNDIKPKNVLVKDSSVYFTDFGTSRSWGAEEGSTTIGEHEGFTQRYCAPETHETKGGRNRSSDMWSLGCVFLEMATVLLDRPLSDLDMFLEQNGTLRADAFWANPEAIGLWIKELRGPRGSSSTCDDSEVLAWTTELLQQSPDDRPTAAQLR
ncbi:kinase-like domain-containing protein, partial [Podospora didyma]